MAGPYLDYILSNGELSIIFLFRIRQKYEFKKEFPYIFIKLSFRQFKRTKRNIAKCSSAN